MRRILLVLATALVALAALPGSASGANGDNLRTITADTSGTACPSIGVGLAFDGTNLLVSCYSDNSVVAVSPVNGAQVAVHFITGASALGALAWDGGRQLLWACSNSSTVGTIDLTTNAFTPAFDSNGCFDGLAYDASDDSLWTSPDATNFISHYSIGGADMGDFSPSLPCGNSGIAVGGPLLYLATNGCSSIYTSDKAFSTAPAPFASFPARLEDMECDNITFAPLGAIWSKDAYDNTLNAWEIPAGSCAFGGGGGGRSTSTIYTGGTTVQYSDPVTLSGTLLDTSVTPNVGIFGEQLDFTLGTQTASAGPTDASGNASTSLQVLQKPGSVTTVGTAFAGDATYKSSSDSDLFTITKEDCTLTYSGDTLVPPATMTTLAADMGEPDASPGDRSTKTLTFTVVDAALNTQTFTATTTDPSGHASTSVALAAGVYGVSVSFAGDDFYLPCATRTDTLVTVAAAAAKVTGGGWVSIGTGRTSFGFNAIPQAGGVFTGQFQLRSNNGKNRFHGNVVSSLSGSGNSATWSGTGSWNGQPGYTYTISVVDNGSSGSKKLDTISITITSPANVVVYTTGGPQVLKGGNITVH